eukprot:TRINITY_DN452_c0_g1_i1.p1 TRINITY_DN452_c0_g1~~TRINITY_DN452_c0_g1_i1.p1  ORF type:complete len:533 (+),score=183.36 TRINITY_DN452_c0_g1_i1:153-1601(+)
MSHVHGENCNHSHSHSHKEPKKKAEKSVAKAQTHSHGDGCNHSEGDGGHSHSHSHSDSNKGGHSHSHSHGEPTEEDILNDKIRELNKLADTFNGWAKKHDQSPFIIEDQSKFPDIPFNSMLSSLLNEMDKEGKEDYKEELSLIGMITAPWLEEGIKTALDLGINQRFSKWMTLFLNSDSHDQQTQVQFVIILFNFVTESGQNAKEFVPLVIQLLEIIKTKRDMWNTEIFFFCFRWIETAFHKGEICRSVFEKEPQCLSILEEISKHVLNVRKESFVPFIITNLIHSIISFVSHESVIGWKDWLWEGKYVPRQLGVLQDLHLERYDLILTSLTIWKVLMIPYYADKMEELRIPQLLVSMLNHTCHPPPDYILVECRSTLVEFYRFLSPLKRHQLDLLCQSYLKPKLELDPKNEYAAEQVRFFASNPQVLLPKSQKETLTCQNPTCKNKDPQNKCSQCKSTFYCSRECQVGDWKRHKKECKPAK